MKITILEKTAILWYDKGTKEDKYIKYIQATLK